MLISTINNSSQSLQYNSSQEQRQQRPFDKARAPKFACLVFFVCIISAGTYHTINGFDLDSLANSATSVHSSKQSTQAHYHEHNHKNHTFTHSQKLKQMFQEISRPILDSQGNPITLPPQLSNLAEVSENLDVENEVPVFWHVPRSGGSLIINTAAYCMDLTQASNVGALISPELEAYDEITTVVDTDTGAKFLNVDTTSPQGMLKARNKKGDLASYPDLDLIITPYILDAAEMLLNHENKGRMFVMMRHPIERAESMYHSLKKRVDTGAVVGDSLLAYAKGTCTNSSILRYSPSICFYIQHVESELCNIFILTGHVIENNWMTRFLCNKLGGQLTPDDEAFAKEVLRTKALVGLVKRRNESYHRFKDYFGWKINDADPKKVECEERFLEWGWNASHYTPIEKGSEEWNLLKKSNTFDLKLYEYAETLFEVQGALLHGDQVQIDDTNNPPAIQIPDSKEVGGEETTIDGSSSSTGTTSSTPDS